MVNLEASAQVKRTTLLVYNLVYSISSEVVLGVSCCCVLSPFISHHDSRLFVEVKLCGYLCCHFFLFTESARSRFTKELFFTKIEMKNALCLYLISRKNRFCACASQTRRKRQTKKDFNGMGIATDSAQS